MKTFLIAIALLCLVLVLWDLFVNGRIYWCKWRHKKNHTLTPTYYGSSYRVDCSKCRQVYMEYRL